MSCTSTQFENIARKYVNSQYTGMWQYRSIPDKVFKSHFKLSSVGAARLWQRLEEKCEGCVYRDGAGPAVRFDVCLPEHLLLTLHMLKTYCSVSVGARFFGVSEKTHRRHFGAIVSFLKHLSTCTVSRIYSIKTCVLHCNFMY